ncbi:hypothetical protein M0R72_08160 [Candidatus Pacearchaeota archaeon]|jgi:hypothetical protein|nr:hypothetical protein [Candidatus Pacearchaeota archaeon]
MSTINSSQIKQQIFDYFDVDKLRTIAGQAGNLEFNPFKLNADGKPIGFDDSIVKAPGMAVDLIKALGIVVEKVCADAGAVASGGEKKKALVELLDEIIKLPFFLEPFDGMIIGWLIDKLIEWLNLKLGQDWVDHLDFPVIIKST